MISSSLAGIWEFVLETERGGRVRMDSIIAPPVLPPKAWRPLAIS